MSLVCVWRQNRYISPAEVCNYKDTPLMDDYHSRIIGNGLCLSLETTLIFPSRVYMSCVIIIYKEISLVEDRAGCVV